MFAKKDYLAADQLAKVLWTISEESYQHGSPWTEVQFCEDIQQPQTEYLLLKKQEEIIGFIGYHMVADEAEISNFVVKRACQHQGNAHKLMVRFFEEMETQKLVHIFLEVRQSNDAARKLYKKEKFHDLGIRKGYYKNPLEDAVIMSARVRSLNG